MSMTKNYPSHLLQFFEDKKIGLIPTDTLWCLCWPMSKVAAIQRVIASKSLKPEDPFIFLMSDLDMLKHYVSRLHPRVETLLSLHRRPLSIVYPEIQNVPEDYYPYRDALAFRVVGGHPIREIIHELREPLVCINAGSSTKFALDYLDILPNIMDLADFQLPNAQDFRTSDGPSVIATYNRKGDLEFIRE